MQLGWSSVRAAARTLLQPNCHIPSEYKYTHKSQPESFFLHLPRKMEPIEGSETSVFKPQTPGKYPKENILHYRHTLRICNTYCFSTATVVTRTRLNVMFIHVLLLFFYGVELKQEWTLGISGA